jgi:hypothetical protein
MATRALALEDDAARRDVAAASIGLGQSLIAAAGGERGEAEKKANTTAPEHRKSLALGKRAGPRVQLFLSC